MKTVVRNNNKEEAEVQDTWYVLVSEDGVRCEDIASPLWSSEEDALRTAEMDHDGTIYVAEVKLITKVVG